MMMIMVPSLIASSKMLYLWHPTDEKKVEWSYMSHQKDSLNKKLTLLKCEQNVAGHPSF